MNCSNPSSFRPGFSRVAYCGLVVLSLVAASPVAVRAQMDDFNDGNDNGWTRYDPIGGALGSPFAQFSVVNGAYRIQTPPSPAPTATFNGRGGSLRPNVYTSFYVYADLVNWNNSLPQSVGLLGRIGTPGAGMTTGYAFTWDRGNPSSATSGDVDISRLTGEQPTGVTLNEADAIHLEPGRSYRFVFLGQGANLEGRVYELPNLTTPKVRVTGTDAMYASGMCGLVTFDNTNPMNGSNPTDATFDNYFALDVEPPTLTLTDRFFGALQISWPAPATNFKLQCSPVLPATAMDWIDYTGGTSEEGGFIYTIVDSSSGNKFYRLIRP